MICPSCGNVAESNDKHCNRCGLALTAKSQHLFNAIGTFSWIMRRALGGMFAGIIGWVVSIALNRAMIIEPSYSLTFHMVYRFAIIGAFLGSVGGIIEHSSYKAFLGGILGCIGGVLGGLINIPIITGLNTSTQLAYLIAHSCSWAVIGLFIGTTSGIIEKKRNKILIGLLAGIIGGAFGGVLGSELYWAELAQPTHSSGWLAERYIEAFAGAVAGMNLWFVIGLVEKLYIFKRKQLVGEAIKVCDSCKTKNSLKSWYCKNCGNTLQVSAPIEKLAITPYRSLERISNAFKFLSRLSMVAGVILGITIFISLLSQSIIFAIFLSVALAIFVYIISIILNSFSESIIKFTKIREAE
ncbi:MAG: hypothetical protein JW983_01795 [Elusimicrobia bacterium]|nr:hypothetical protein [Elusimicrobiota bacterium]